MSHNRFDLLTENETFEEYSDRIKDFAIIEELPVLYSQAIERYEHITGRKISLKLFRDISRIPSDIKKLVWERADGRCENCNSKWHLEFDHIIPVSKGGSNSENNVQVLCRKCNRKKRDKIE